MDLATGRMYATKEDALAAGVPESDIAEVVRSPEANKLFEDMPIVQFSKGPFRDRQYRRHPGTGQLVRVDQTRA